MTPRKGGQSDPDSLLTATRPGPFDIIIDDAAHIGYMAKDSFNFLYRDHLKGGGLYILEDYAVSLLREDWVNSFPYSPPIDEEHKFPSFEHGMIGFAKQLIDQMLYKRHDSSCFDIGMINFQPGIVIIEKITGQTIAH